jgi:hypothetical protein
MHMQKYRQSLSSESQESELLYDWRFTSNQFVLATIPLRLTTNNLIFQLNTCGYSPYVISSLSRGWVCRLQLLPVLDRVVFLRSVSRGTHDNMLLSQIQDSPKLEGKVPIFISPQKGVVQFIFVASYDSQGYAGSIRPRLHTGDWLYILQGWDNLFYPSLLIKWTGKNIPPLHSIPNLEVHATPKGWCLPIAMQQRYNNPENESMNIHHFKTLESYKLPPFN